MQAQPEAHVRVDMVEMLIVSIGCSLHWAGCRRLQFAVRKGEACAWCPDPQTPTHGVELSN
jgi:hypothetical protein